MSDVDFDLIVIGTGPSASTVAKKSCSGGSRVAVVEAREFGGTCALRGCNPKKVYTNAGNLVDRARGAQSKQIEFERLWIDWHNLHDFKREFTQPVKEETEANYRERGIKTYSGTASFAGPNSIRAGDHQITAQRIFVGVGAYPRPLNIPGGEYAVHSDEFLELLTLPERVVFIGGGYVSMEFAGVAARYGSGVTVLQRGGQVLQPFDPDLVAQLVAYCAENNITINIDAAVTAIERTDGGLRTVRYETSEGSRAIEADLVVHGAGRVPNLVNMNLKSGEVEYGEDGIQVNAFMQSVSNPIVYAAGDCADTGQPRLTPTANEEARAVVKNIFANEPTCRPDYGLIPQVAFTIPSIAAIGMSQAAAEKSHEVEVRYEDTSSWG